MPVALQGLEVELGEGRGRGGLLLEQHDESLARAGDR
jgi:hypothetical protein